MKAEHNCLGPGHGYSVLRGLGFLRGQRGAMEVLSQRVKQIGSLGSCLIGRHAPSLGGSTLGCNDSFPFFYFFFGRATRLVES